MMRCLLAGVGAFLLLCTAMHCHRPPAPATNSPARPEVSVGDNSRNSLDWPGTYIGTVPTSDGNNLVTGLQLRKDGTFRLETTPEGGTAQPVVETGNFEWDRDGGGIKLLGIDSTNRPIYYQVGENHLRQLDLVNQSIEGQLTDRYHLAKDTTGLNGTTWQLKTLDGTPVDIGKNQPTLTFTILGNGLAGLAACNRYRTEYAIVAEGSIDIPHPIATKMACPELATEQQFFEALEGASSYEFMEDNLVLRDTAGAIVATFSPM
ncbi:heat shock protein HslJ [Neolewinella xylanilytica]|uniref:Heat shock protein HslJ n=2 Tax=Neolewinella xylanilytica TaxID=1514080 RepID=A0A2S6I0D5_9BACT|nr:heat shock protein HslJ [Neolewinella xylanilytica]